MKVSRKGSNRKRKGAQSFATGGFNKTMNAVTGMVNSKPVMNTLKKYTGTQDQRNQSVIEDYNKQQEKEARAQKAREIKSMKGSRKGCLECKGSRPDNLNQIALNISNGRKRSLHLNDISDEESRKGSRKGKLSRDIKTIIENSVIKDGYEYDFSKTTDILKSMGYSIFEIDDFVDDYMDTQWEI